MGEGLLDFLKTPAGQGLLGAVAGGMAGARKGQPWNTAGAAGLGGLLAYNQGVGNQTSQALKDMQIAEAKRKADAIAALPEADRQAVTAGVPLADIWKSRNPEAKYVDGFDAQGRPVKGWATPQGFNQIGGSQAKPIEYKDAGGRLIAVDPYTGEPISGKEIAKTMSAAERDASSRGWAGINLQKEAQNLPKFSAEAGGFVYAPNAQNPAGRVVAPAGMVAGGNVSEGERKAATLLKRMEGSLSQLNAAISPETGSPGAAKPEILPAIARTLTFGNDAVANTATSGNRQKVEAAQLDILDSALTLGTGAAYTKEQLEGYRKSFFPQFGDSDEVVRDKQARLDNVIQAGRIAAGRAAPKASNGGWSVEVVK